MHAYANDNHHEDDDDDSGGGDSTISLMNARLPLACIGNPNCKVDGFSHTQPVESGKQLQVLGWREQVPMRY